MPKQKRDVSQDQVILTGQFLRLAQRMGRSDLTTVPDQTTIKTALNQLKSAVKVAQNAYDLIVAAQSSHEQQISTPWPAQHPAVPNGSHREDEALPQRPAQERRSYPAQHHAPRASDF